MGKRCNPRGSEWIEGLDLGIALVSPQGLVRFANKRFAEILGIKPHLDLTGKDLTRYIASHSSVDFHSALAASRHQRVEGEIHILQNGKFRIIDATFDSLHSAPNTIRIVISEITAAIETNRTLQKYEESVQSLSARILQLQDEERRRIARELHDTSGQDLAVILINLSQVSSKLQQDAVPDDVRQKLCDAISIARKVEGQIRSLSYVLHPPLLDELGLSAALRWYAEGFKKRTGIDVELALPDQAPRLRPEYETALFRVVQECLSNILRHSGSNRARLRLYFADGLAEISIRDYGKGIPPQKLVETSQGKQLGVGIAGMRERLQQFGGNIDIRSSDRGTLVVARVPMESPQHPTQQLPSASTEERAPALPTNAPKRILIADDHDVTRRGIKSLLQNEPDLSVCGEAEDGLQAATRTAQLKPDLVILDITMPRAGGFGAIRKIHENCPGTKILVFTTHNHWQLAATVQASGCSGFVSKAKVSEDLIKAIRTVLAGGKFFVNLESPQGSGHAVAAKA